MRLADRILDAAENQRQDRLHRGALSSMAASLRQAQHFEFAPQMLEAADRVRRTRPSTMVAALPMVRFPYKATWFEWLGGDVMGDREATPNKPTPQRLGVLVDCIDKKLQIGFATWAWQHHGADYPVVCPVGVVFDNSDTGELTDLAEKITTQTYGREAWLPPTEARARVEMAQTPRWAKLASDDREVAATVQLERRIRVSATLHTEDMFRLLTGHPSGAAAIRSALADIEGEPLFLYSLMILLNSRNVVTRETEDLSRLNRARAKQRKRPLLPFVRTNIVLSRVQGRRAGTGDPIERRRHLVMGHFKVRATGVFWWTPHSRGTGAEVRRTHYRVEADKDLNRELAAAMETR